MKCLKKLTSFVLTGALCLGLVTPAMAAETLELSASLDTSVVYLDDGAQNVTLTISGGTEFSVSSASMDVVAKDSSGNELTVKSASSSALTDCTLTDGKILAATSDGSNATTDTLITVVLSIDENTAEGTYTVGVENLEVVYDSWQTHSVDQTVTTSLEVKQSKETTSTGYTATVANASTNSTIRVGDTITVKIGANQAHSASKMTLTYDSGLVTYKSATGCEVNSNTAGALELASYGAEKATTDYYTLTFTAISDGDAAFALTDAAFGTGESSETASLTDATVPSALNITIAKAQHGVTLPEIFAGATSVEDGATYTFTPETATGAYYNYTNPSVTMNGTDVTANLSGDATSGWSITNVTGPLVITGTRSEKSYNVTINTVFGEETTATNATATYNTPYEFTVPDDVTAGEDVGYTYTLTSVTVNGTPYTGYSVADGTRNYTIPGADVKGDIVITITKIEEAANTFNVSITGDGAGQVSADPTKVTKGNDVTLTLTPDAGYAYVIKVNGQEVTLVNNQYTITNVQSAADVTVTVDKNLITTYMTSGQYVQLDGTVMWLIKIAPTDPSADTSAQISGKTYTYNSNNMYWSSAYNAYVTLVVAESAPTLAATDFAIVAVDTIPTITYDMNVNMSDDNVVDPADAQLVWNMYSAVYSGTTTNVSLEKFLKADVNTDGKVSTEDAAAIIASVLKLTTT